MRETLLINTFVELTDVLVDDFDVVDLLTQLAGRCVEVLDVDAAGIMLASADGELRVVASSSEAMRTLELFELQASEGPCFECYNTGEPTANIQLTDIGQPWPQFSPRAVAAGFLSVTALPMRLRGRTIGALNLFRSNLGDLGDQDLVAAPGVRRCCDHRHPAASRRRGGSHRQRPAHVRAQQPNHRRAGEGDGGRADGARHGSGVQPAPEPRPPAQPPAVRSGSARGRR